MAAAIIKNDRVKRSARSRSQTGKQTGQRLAGRSIGDSVHARRPKMALKRADDRFGGNVEQASGFNRITIPRQHGLQRFNLVSRSPPRKRHTFRGLNGLYEVSYAFAGQNGPRKLFARIDLAAWRCIGVRQHPLRQDSVAPDNIPAKCDHFSNLPGGEMRITERVPLIDYLDPDRERVDIFHPLPRTFARVPGARCLGHHLHEAPGLMDKGMRGDLAWLMSEPVLGCRAGLQAGVMKNNGVRLHAAAARTEIWRSAHQCLLIVGGERAHAGRRALSISSKAAFNAATRVLATARNSCGTPRAIRRSGWLSATSRR